MIIKGRCRGNGAQLANYLLNTKDNDRAEFLAVYGAASQNPRHALLEMSLTSELSGRTQNGLYHTQLSPRVDEAAAMTQEQRQRAVEIMAEQLGMQGHKWALFEHEKDGRTHMHLVFERYDHERGIMWKDDKNFEKHELAARQMEIEFGWQLTHQKKNHLDLDIKGHISNMWRNSDNGAGFVAAMDKAGFEVTQGIDKRPYQIVDQYGTVHDLSRQLKGVKQAEVSQYLNSIRADLRPTAEASQDRRDQYSLDHSAPVQPDNSRELSSSLDIAKAMIDNQKQIVEPEPEQPKIYSYGFKFEQPLTDIPALPQEPEPKAQSHKPDQLSDSQDKAAAMLELYRQKKAEQERKMQEAKQQQIADNQADITDVAARMLAEYQRKQEERKQQRSRERGLELD